MTKTNLSKAYAKDKSLEQDGKWFQVAEGVEFKLKRMGGSNATNVNKIRANIIKPHVRLIEKNLLDKDVEKGLYVKVFVQACLVDWKGLLDHDDQEIPFTKEFAQELLKETPDLFDDLVDLANEGESYKEDLGKS
tara:strand:- start:9961 stop:10365 length:405 start_codon:yes stop_codon:yes gene_type:complete